mmetsp:Transcript_74443/g.197745  ORF Transcript_74443/g.197745 Transcript_74443/m.197745 type:complete len:204 (+) Transcript_74443:418-1029(+)
MLPWICQASRGWAHSEVPVASTTRSSNRQRVLRWAARQGLLEQTGLWHRPSQGPRAGPRAPGQPEGRSRSASQCRAVGRRRGPRRACLLPVGPSSEFHEPHALSSCRVPRAIPAMVPPWGRPEGCLPLACARPGASTAVALPAGWTAGSPARTPGLAPAPSQAASSPRAGSVAVPGQAARSPCRPLTRGCRVSPGPRPPWGGP